VAAWNPSINTGALLSIYVVESSIIHPVYLAERLTVTVYTPVMLERKMRMYIAMPTMPMSAFYFIDDVYEDLPVKT
jgi:hypothetical protein